MLLVDVEDRCTGTIITRVYRCPVIRVGRAAGNELVIDDGTVAPWHGVFHVTPAALRFVDLGSMLGTRAAGRLVWPHEAAIVGTGDIVQVGQVMLSPRVVSPRHETGRRNGARAHAPETDRPSEQHRL